MRGFDETLERISRSGEAVFAVDSAQRIILWNKACERLLARPARSAVGKSCYDVLCGRDINGNIYCHRNCAVAFQAREMKDEPVRNFHLTAKTGDGKKKEISTSMFAIPSYHPALNTLVHVLREGNGAASPAGPPRLPAAEPSEPPAESEPLSPVTLSGGETDVLTVREKEILRCLAEGMGTGAIAKRLFIATVTVRNHVQSILHKLDVHTKVAAVVLAYRHGLV
jgi:DNA-binding CsgD family transcriptional regulator